MQYHVIPCNNMQYHAIQCNTMQHNATPCNTMQYHLIQCNTMQYHAILCNTMQYHAIPCMLYNCWRSVPLPCGQYMAIFSIWVIASFNFFSSICLSNGSGIIAVTVEGQCVFLLSGVLLISTNSWRRKIQKLLFSNFSMIFIMTKIKYFFVTAFTTVVLFLVHW